MRFYKIFFIVITLSSCATQILVDDNDCVNDRGPASSKCEQLFKTPIKYVPKYKVDPNQVKQQLKPYDIAYLTDASGARHEVLITAIKQNSNNIMMAQIVWTLNSQRYDQVVNLDSLTPKAIKTNSNISQGFFNELYIKVDDVEAVMVGNNNTNSQLNKMSQRINKKMDVKVIYSSQLNDQNNSNGYYGYGSKIKYPSGASETKDVINISKKGYNQKKPGLTEWHEIGHAQTKKNLSKNIKDPMAVQFYPKIIKDDHPSYRKYSQADESRQFAINFIKSLRSLPESEITQLYSQRKYVSLKELFSDFSQISNDSSERTPQETFDLLSALNLRHSNYIQIALERLSNQKGRQISKSYYNNSNKKFFEFDFIEATIRVPITEEVDLIYSGLNDENQKENFERTYFKDYLTSTLDLLKMQKSALIDSRLYLDEIANSPTHEITQEEYLKIRSAFTRVKSTVNLKSSETTTPE